MGDMRVGERERCLELCVRKESEGHVGCRMYAVCPHLQFYAAKLKLPTDAECQSQWFHFKGEAVEVERQCLKGKHVCMSGAHGTEGWEIVCAAGRRKLK
jgi:hypothetical protein